MTLPRVTGSTKPGSCSSSPQPCREKGRTFCPTLKEKNQCQHPPKPCPPCPKVPPPSPGPKHNQTITLDKPFVTALDSTSMIQLGTCHMMLLFHDNYYADGGAVQMIGAARTASSFRVFLVFVPSLS